MTTDARVVLVTCGSLEEAGTIARTLVQEKQAACVNIIPSITSVYFWEGDVQTDQECLLLIKSRGECLEALQARIKQLHSYSVPEFLVLPVESGSSDYLAWLVENTPTPQT